MSDALDRPAKDDWITLVLGRDPRQRPVAPPVDPRVAAARAAIPTLAKQFAVLVAGLKLARGGEALIGEASTLQSRIAALGDNDGDAAQADLGHYRDCLARATELRDGEVVRRRDIVAPLDTLYTDSKLAAAQAALVPSLPLLADADDWRNRLNESAKAVQAARRDPRLGLIGSNADAFDAGALAATEICGKWDNAKADVEAAVAAEQKARREAVPALVGRAKLSSDALTAEVETANRLAPKKDPTKFFAALGTAVPGWAERAALLANLARVPPNEAQTLPYPAYTRAMQGALADCAGAEKLAPKIKAWTSEFAEVQPLGRAVSTKAIDFAKNFTAAKAGVSAAMLRIQTTIGDGDFAAAKQQINALSETLAAAEAAGATAAKFYPEAKASTEAAMRNVGTALGAGEFDTARGEIGTLAATLEAAGSAGGKLPEALKTWKQREPALKRALPAQTGALTRLAATLKQKPGELVADPAALANAQIFLAGVGGIGALQDATGTVNGPMSNFRDRGSPYADVLARQQKAILEKALPATDRRFATATAEMRALGKQASTAFELRGTITRAQIKLRDDIAKQLGNDSKATLTLQAQVNKVDADTGDPAQQELARIRGLLDTLKASSEALDQVVEAGSKALGTSNFGRSTLVALRIQAEAAIEAQIGTGGGTIPPEIGTLDSAYKDLAEFIGSDNAADAAIAAAEKVPTPSELVEELRAEHTRARELAVKLSKEPAKASLQRTERLAALLTATTATFARIDTVIAHGASDAAKAMQIKRQQAIEAARAWTGDGGAFRAELSSIVGDLPSALADAYALQRAKRNPDEAIRQHTQIVATFATLPDKPPPPADPVPLIAAIDKQAGNDALGAIKRLTADIDPLFASIATIFPLLTAIAGYAADWAALQANYGTAVADAHPKPKKELEKLKNAADEKRLTDPVKGRAELAALRLRVDEIRNKSAGWKGAVPNPAPRRGGTFANTIDATNAAKTLLKDGGLTLAAIESLVPAGTNNTYEPTHNYPTGFKFAFTTTNGKTIEMWGHGPSHGPNVDPTSISAQGNIVRIKIDGQFLQSDAKKKYSSLTDEGHIPLFGNP